MPLNGFSVRLGEDQRRELELIAVVANTSLSELVREAIDDFIHTHKKHPSFQAALELHIERMQQMRDSR